MDTIGKNPCLEKKTVLSKVEEEKKALELKKKKLLIREKMLKEKEKKQKARLFSEIGKLVFRAKIGQMERDAMLGAFLEINENMKIDGNIQAWKERAINFLDEQDRSEQQPVAVVFRGEPRKEIREQLKARKFRWNFFRKEFYGHGNKNEIEKLLEGAEFEVEVVT